MAVEVTVVYRDDCWMGDHDTYAEWLADYLERTASGITVMLVEIEEV